MPLCLALEGKVARGCAHSKRGKNEEKSGKLEKKNGVCGEANRFMPTFGRYTNIMKIRVGQKYNKKMNC